MGKKLKIEKNRKIEKWKIFSIAKEEKRFNNIS